MKTLIFFTIFCIIFIANMVTFLTGPYLASDSNELKSVADEFTKPIKKLWNAGNAVGKLLTVFLAVGIFILFLPTFLLCMLFYLCCLVSDIIACCFKFIAYFCFPRLHSFQKKVPIPSKKIIKKMIHYDINFSFCGSGKIVFFSKQDYERAKKYIKET